MNDQNLVHFTSDQSHEEAVKNGRKGGIASGEARRRNNQMSEICLMLLDMEVNDANKDKIKKILPNIPPDQMTHGLMAAIGQWQSATKGNTSAFVAVNEQAEKARAKHEAEAKNKKGYRMDLRDIPFNFHRLVHDMEVHGHQQYVLHGGRGSMKSSTAAMTIIELLINNPNAHAIAMRQVGNTMKDSVFAKLKWAINKQGLSDQFKITKSPMEITLIATGQKIYFRGADDPGKLKSITPEFGYIAIIWFEELDQFAGADAVRNIEQSVIRGGNDAWIIKTFNPPISRNNWANQYAAEATDFKFVHKSKYTDLEHERQWLGDAFIQEAEHLKETNPKAYAHEYDGEVIGTGGQVFEFLEIREITDEEIERMDRIYPGVDFGWFPDQFCYLRTYYDSARNKIYLMDELYVNKWSNQQTAEWIKEKGYDDYTIICDSAEPKSINDYRDMGIPARGAVKGAGSVDYGFKFLQRRTIVIDPNRTPNAYREITEYEYERDKDGNFISGYPDGNDHAISALRYAYEPLFNRRGNSA